MLEAIATAALAEIVKAAARRLMEKVPLGEIGETSVDADEIKAAVMHHLRMVNAWSQEISFRDLARSKALRSSFVDLDLRLGARGGNEQPTDNPASVSEVAGLPGHFVLLGDPGAGKTTSLKRIAQSCLRHAAKNSAARLPILVRLRAVGEEGTLLSALQTILGFAISFDPDLDKDGREGLRARLITQHLERLSATLLIDGLDEVDPPARDSVIADLRYLSLHGQKLRVMLTCRTADYTTHLDRMRTFRIEPLSPQQVEEFATRWLGERAEVFVEQIESTPYVGAEVRPLTLAHLCAIYERSGTIPEKPRTVYRKIVRLLLEEWDEQRSVRRHSRYAGFSVDRKEDFLRAIAFALAARSRQSAFSEEELEAAYLHTYAAFGLPRGEMRHVVRELESHTGLIVSDGFDRYEFAHKSLQEYLVAEYILRLPHVPREVGWVLPDELALAVALSSDAAGYFAEVVKSLPEGKRGVSSFAEPFVRRLMIEKVDFVADPELGWAVTRLYSLAYHSTGPTQLALPFGVDATVFVEFLGLPPIRKSVAKVLSRAAIEDLDGDRVRVRTSRWSHVVDKTFLTGAGRPMPVPEAATGDRSAPLEK